MTNIDEQIVKTQLELSEEHSSRSGQSSYRQPDPDVDHVLVGHNYGYDQIAFRLSAPHRDWKKKTAVLDVAFLTIADAPSSFGGSAYVLRYPSLERERLKRFVLELIEETDPTEVVRSTDEIIDRWSKLWGRIQGPLSLVQQRGLFGELLALERFIQAGGGGVVHDWEGPNDALHDFSFQTRHVEVKVTGHEDPALEISSFNQLRPCHPELVLLMIQMREGGQLTLPTLVARIRGVLTAAPAELEVFERRLEKARYFNDHAPHYPTPYEDFLLSSILIDHSVDILHEDRLSSPIAGLVRAKWTLDPRTLAFMSIQDDFWVV